MVDGVHGVHGFRALSPVVVEVRVGPVHVTTLHRIMGALNVMENHRKQSHATQNIV